MTRAEKKLLRRPATPPRYSISPLRENPQQRMSSLRVAPRRRHSPAYSISPVRQPTQGTQQSTSPAQLSTQAAKRKVLPPPPTSKNHRTTVLSSQVVKPPSKVQKRPILPPTTQSQKIQTPTQTQPDAMAKRRKVAEEVIRRLDEEKAKQQPRTSTQDEVSLDVLSQYGYVDDNDYTLVLDDGED